MRVVTPVALLVALATVPAATAASITLRDKVPAGESRTLTIAARTPVSVEVVLRVPATGRTLLFLEGPAVRRKRLVIDTRSSRCARARGFRVCRARYRDLRAGSYTWRVRRAAGTTAAVVLTIRWS